MWSIFDVYYFLFKVFKLCDINVSFAALSVVNLFGLNEWIKPWVLKLRSVAIVVGGISNIAKAIIDNFKP